MASPLQLQHHRSNKAKRKTGGRTQQYRQSYTCGILKKKRREALNIDTMDKAKSSSKDPTTVQDQDSSHPNPYASTKKPSYKDVLLSQVDDQMNRMGIDTFHLIHLLKKSQSSSQESQSVTHDDLSVSSASTNPQNNVTMMGHCRMRFQVTLTENATDNYMEELATQVNNILEVININTPRVKLMPWQSRSVDQ